MGNPARLEPRANFQSRALAFPSICFRHVWLYISARLPFSVFVASLLAADMSRCIWPLTFVGLRPNFPTINLFSCTPNTPTSPEEQDTDLQEGPAPVQARGTSIKLKVSTCSSAQLQFEELSRAQDRQASSAPGSSCFIGPINQEPHESGLSAGPRRSSPNKQQTSFKDEVGSQIISNNPCENGDVFGSDNNEDISESAVTDKEDSLAWEDTQTDSGASTPEQLFQRVDSRLHQPPCQSLLTTLIHEPALAEQALKASTSTPVLRRSKTSSPNGPSLVTSPEESILDKDKPEVPGARPIVTRSNTDGMVLSPRTIRRNMLEGELTESLRKHLLRERQQKVRTADAVLK